MKLTKGKISKLYNKKRQSLKKHKKLKSSYKKRTFRKRKVNLARKTLKKIHYKKYRGGEGEDTVPPKDVDTFNEPAVNQPTEQPIVVEQPIVEEPIVEEPVTDTINEVKNESRQSTEVLPVEDLTNQSVSETKLSDSVTNITNRMADIISDKVTKNILSTQSGEKPQDGFSSVNKAAETIASSGGTKNKNKTQ
jgi:hypothetical protein